MSPSGKLAAVAMISALSGGLLTWGFLVPYSARQSIDDTPSSLAVTFSPGLDERSTLSESASLSHNDPRLSLRQLGILASRAALEDPASAVRRASEIPGHENREVYLGEVLRVWGEQDGVAAATFVRENFQGRDLSDALYFVADGWAEVDPAGAATWFLAETEGSIQDDALWEALESWGRKDPRTAFDWALQLDEFARPNALQALAEGWGAIDPAAAIDAGMEMRQTDEGQEFLISTAMQWVDRDPAAATAWATGLENERLRASVLYEISDLWARSDPARAAAWTATLADQGAREVAEAGLAKGWSLHDPASAADWALRTIRPEDRLDEIVGDIFFNWTNADARGASRWLDAGEAGPARDRVLQAYSSLLTDQDPEAAVAWASRISDGTAREQHLRLLLDELVAKYGDWARRQIGTYDLPENLKREFAAPVE